MKIFILLVINVLFNLSPSKVLHCNTTSIRSIIVTILRQGPHCDNTLTRSTLLQYYFNKSMLWQYFNKIHILAILQLDPHCDSTLTSNNTLTKSTLWQYFNKIHFVTVLWQGPQCNNISTSRYSTLTRARFWQYFNKDDTVIVLKWGPQTCLDTFLAVHVTDQPWPLYLSTTNSFFL